MQCDLWKNGGSEAEVQIRSGKSHQFCKKPSDFALRSVKRQAISGVLASKFELQLGEEEDVHEIFQKAKEPRRSSGKRPEEPTRID